MWVSNVHVLNITYGFHLVMCIHINVSSFSFFFSAFTMFIAITFPFFDGLLGFFGGFAFAPTTYFVSHEYASQFINSL